MPLKHVVIPFIRDPKAIIKNIRFRQPVTISNRKFIFVIGAPRSGSTLIKSLLCAHSKLAGTKCETTSIFHLRDSFQIKRYPGELKNSVDFEKALYLASDIIDFYEIITSQFVLKNASRNNIFVDKINGSWGARLLFLRKYFPNAFFVNIVRDGRDCFCSARHNKHVNEYQAHNLKKYAIYWKKNLDARERLGHGPYIYDIRYEDLTTNPELTLRRLMEAIGENYENSQIDINKYSKSTNLMNVANHHRNLGKPITSKSQKRWKQELSIKEVRQFTSIAGSQLRRWNYA